MTSCLYYDVYAVKMSDIFRGICVNVNFRPTYYINRNNSLSLISDAINIFRYTYIYYISITFKMTKLSI